MIDVQHLRSWLAWKSDELLSVPELQILHAEEGEAAKAPVTLHFAHAPVSGGGQAAVAKAELVSGITAYRGRHVALRVALLPARGGKAEEAARLARELGELARDRPQEFPGLMPILAVGEMTIPLRDFDDQEFATDRRLARLAVEIMPWGLPLQMWLHKLGSPVGELEAIRLLLPAMLTVSNVHQHKGVIHRDIDEGNLVIVGQDLKVADFGIATTFVPQRGYTTTTPLGTKGRLPPEIVNASRKAGPFTDAWSLGRVLLLMLTGVGSPYLDERGGPFCSAVDGLPPQIRRVVKGLCAVRIEDRWALTDAIAALREIEEDHRTAATEAGAGGSAAELLVLEGSPNVSAGWYADPHKRNSLRWWTGSAWTVYTKPLVASAAGPQAGWYPCPINNQVVRWWDGRKWTRERRTRQGGRLAAGL
ncbi:protein kinase domain-containing protein [Buchananella hordeovulneris]|uniref:protein kinase domain-containing protein n=1 Tax=Buchananella hordeovulneris TaxID=52770 RepID=UPI0026DCF9F5|nr:DUF2510 domain-containing protein [Buchananella hordeovulneris]MDO5080649.1 DUF2510 domain-containing protein [Buchananella hordeovulneris]